MVITKFRGQYAYLSNFYPAKIIVKGIVWPSSEHLYQALKTKSAKEQEAVRVHSSTGLKRFSRTLTLRNDWEEVKYDLMCRIVRAKFRQNLYLKELLCSTTEILVEENYWHDNYWGTCMCHDCIHIPGRNALGEILMTLRSNLKLECGYVNSLAENEVFVFGSNLAGRHERGAAKLAKDKFGAVYGQGMGPQGQCYAIPTKNESIQTLPLRYIRGHVDEFILYVKKHPHLRFLVTEIGCGLAGAPLFKECLKLDNVILTESFRIVLKTLGY